MHFNTLITTVLSASIAVTGVAGSDISERATSSTAANVATLKSIVDDPTAFCTFWQAEYRTRTPFKELSVSQANNACYSIIPAATPITTCVKSDLAILKAAFTEPQYFCNFYSAVFPRVNSPFTDISAFNLMAVCKYCLPSTSSTLSSSVKASSTSTKSSSKTSKSSSKSSAVTTSSKASSSHSSSASYKSLLASSTRISSSASYKSASSSVPRSSYSSASVSKSSSKSSSISSSKSSSVSASVSSSVSSSASVSVSSSASSSASLSSSGSSSISLANAAPSPSAQGYLYAVDSDTTADGTALEGFTNGATDVGFGLTSSGYGPLAYRLDSAGHLYLGSSGVLLSGSTGATSADKLGALANGTSNWTPVICAVDNSTSILSCSYDNTYGQLFDVFQLYSGTTNGATAYYLQMATSGSTADVTIKALTSYTASSTSAAAATAAASSTTGDAAAATITAAASSTSSATTTTSSTTPPYASLTCDPVATGVFNLYASYSEPNPGSVGKPLRNTAYNVAAFYLTDTDTFYPLNFTYEVDTGYLSNADDDTYLMASTAALVETSVAVLPLTANSYTPINCAFDATYNCSLSCKYETAYPMNYTVAQNFNVLDLQYNTDNTNDYYNLEMNQYGYPAGVILTAVPVSD